MWKKAGGAVLAALFEVGSLAVDLAGVGGISITVIQLVSFVVFAGLVCWLIKDLYQALHEDESQILLAIKATDTDETIAVVNGTPLAWLTIRDRADGTMSVIAQGTASIRNLAHHEIRLQTLQLGVYRTRLRFWQKRIAILRLRNWGGQTDPVRIDWLIEAQSPEHERLFSFQDFIEAGGLKKHGYLALEGQVGRGHSSSPRHRVLVTR